MNESVALLRMCLERYQQEMDRVEAELRPGDGILGLGNDPKRSPSHMEFYNEVGRIIGLISGGELPADEAAETAAFLMTMGERFGRRFTRPMMEAAQGHILPLVPLLTPEQAGVLARQYAGLYPRHQRLPIQRQLLKALEKRTAG